MDSSKNKKDTIEVDNTLIQDTPLSDKFAGTTLENLANMGVQLFNPEELDRGVLKQVEEAIAKKEYQQEITKLNKIKNEINVLNESLTKMNSTLNKSIITKEREAIKLDINIKKKRLQDLKTQEKASSKSVDMKKHEMDELTKIIEGDDNQQSRNTIIGGVDLHIEETEREKLIRIGKITPFDNFTSTTSTNSNTTTSTPNINNNTNTTTNTTATTSNMSDQTISNSSRDNNGVKRKKLKRNTEKKRKIHNRDEIEEDELQTNEKISNDDGGFEDFEPYSSESESESSEFEGNNRKRKSKKKSKGKNAKNIKGKRKQTKPDIDMSERFQGESTNINEGRRNHNRNEKDSINTTELTQDLDNEISSSQEWANNIGESNDESSSNSEQSGDEIIEDSTEEDDSARVKIRNRREMVKQWTDDGNEQSFESRLTQWKKLRNKNNNNNNNNSDSNDNGFENEEVIEFDGGFKIPKQIHDNLFEYQQTGVRWMWELHKQEVGGIIGDEMGLGKTIQIISFLGGLCHSNLLNGAVLVVCPATIMTQWVKEFHIWFPPFRVVLLHSSGTSTGNTSEVLKKVVNNHHPNILITTYEGVRIHQDLLTEYHWEYVILDEGHKIRNPDAEITLACKRLGTSHRLILTGSPIQNNLTELWSLFDFVFPGRLGTLPIFKAQFEIPIHFGGFANANDIQVQTAYKCAIALRDLINPYLLRRVKADVLKSLPKKSEQVLFCQLTNFQREEYKRFISGQDVAAVLDGKRHALYAIDILRKICNHPDLLRQDENMKPSDYGNAERSGKLKVVDQILPLWREENHKVLLFCQTRQMLDIVEKFVNNNGYIYRRMDGNTQIKDRIGMVEEFNNDPNIFLFLLTTKVGGLGINLTGADRVLLFDPDWNPSTDVQARERVWRIGQKREVTVYRLITSGTIEEKIYHRQIFKTFLTNKILKDPKQKRFFKSRAMSDLFTLGTETKRGTETSDIFAGLKTEIDLNENEDSNNQREKKQINKRGKSAPDSNILKKLFDNDGLQGAIHHDKIMEGTGQEKILVEYEAEKIARKAVEVLKRSSQQIQRGTQFTLTWTGKSGFAGAPVSNPPRFGVKSNISTNNNNIAVNRTTKITNNMNVSNNVNSVKDLFNSPRSTSSITNTESTTNNNNDLTAGFSRLSSTSSPLSSSQLFQKMKQRSGDTKSTPHSLSKSDESSEQLISQLHEFLTAKGSSTTEEIIDNFKLSVQPEEAAIFRSMLRQIATFNKQEKKWELKSEWSVRLKQ